MEAFMGSFVKVQQHTCSTSNKKGADSSDWCKRDDRSLPSAFKRRSRNYNDYVVHENQLACKDWTVLCNSPISLNPSTENQGEFSQLKPSPIVESGAVIYQWHAVSGTSTAHLLQSSCHWGTWTHIRAANIREKMNFIIFDRALRVFRDWSWHKELLRLIQVLLDAF